VESISLQLRLQEAEVLLIRNLLLIVVVALLVGGCAIMRKAEEPKMPVGPFDIAILAVSDTRGELEPCG
jgi:uncharacterized protein YceK